MDAQASLRNSRILLINFTSVGVEICKNLMLAGVGSLTIVDGNKVLDQDMASNFFLSSSQIGRLKLEACRNSISDLNKRVQLNIVTDDWRTLSDLETFISKFSLTIATGVNKEEIIRLNNITRTLNIPFSCTSTHGLFGFIFADLIEHHSTVKYDKSSQKKVGRTDEVSTIIKIHEKQENDKSIQECLMNFKYRPFSEIGSTFIKNIYRTPKKQIRKVSVLLPGILGLLEYESAINKKIEDVNISEKELLENTKKVLEKMGLPMQIATDNTKKIAQLAKQAYCEYQPISSIIGGAVSQDIINCLVGKEVPIDNFVVLDGSSDEMLMYIL